MMNCLPSLTCGRCSRTHHDSGFSDCGSNRRIREFGNT